MSTTTKTTLSNIFKAAWAFVKKNGMTMSAALKCAWANAKLKAAMKTRIVKFYFQKVDGSIREAYGTLAETIIGEAATSNGGRKPNESVQVYYDTEKAGWRCFKKANIIKMA